jgi:hypothetical protein
MRDKHHLEVSKPLALVFLTFLSRPRWLKIYSVFMRLWETVVRFWEGIF